MVKKLELPKNAGLRLRQIAKARGEAIETLIDRIALAMLNQPQELARLDSRLRAADRNTPPEPDMPLDAWAAARKRARYRVNGRVALTASDIEPVLTEYGVKMSSFKQLDDGVFCIQCDINASEMAIESRIPLPNFRVFLKRETTLGLPSSKYELFRPKYSSDGVVIIRSLLSIRDEGGGYAFDLAEPNQFAYSGRAYKVSTNIIMIGEDNKRKDQLKDIIQIAIHEATDVRVAQYYCGIMLGTSSDVGHMPHSSRVVLIPVEGGDNSYPAELVEENDFLRLLREILTIPEGVHCCAVPPNWPEQRRRLSTFL